MTQTALYRHFSADGRLLYVGIANDHLRRLMQHGYSPWFDEVASVTVERYPSRDEAHAAERKAIRKEKPLHNRQRYAGPRVPTPKVKAAPLPRLRPEPVAEPTVAETPPTPPVPQIFRFRTRSMDQAFCSPQRLRMFDEGKLTPLDHNKWRAGGYGPDPFGIAARSTSTFTAQVPA